MSKKILGIDCAARFHAIGGFFVGAVVVDNINFFRKFSRFDFKKANSKEDRAKIIKACKDHMWYDVLKRPANIIRTKDTSGLETEGIIEMLNRIPKFWKGHQIHINNSKESREQFLGEFEEKIPHNLKWEKNKFEYSKWKITHDADKKYNIVALAQIIAKWAQDTEYAEIEQVWGDFGTGFNYDEKTQEFIKNKKDCPYIRTPFKPE